MLRKKQKHISKQSCCCTGTCIARSSRIITGKIDFNEILENLIDDAFASDISKQKDARLGCDRGEEAAVRVLAEIAEKLGLNSFFFSFNGSNYKTFAFI